MPIKLHSMNVIICKFKPEPNSIGKMHNKDMPRAFPNQEKSCFCEKRKCDTLNQKIKKIVVPIMPPSAIN